MLRINRANALDGFTLDVELSNGHTLLLDMTGLVRVGKFPPQRELAVFCYPHTDGQCVWWDGGPRLSLAELFGMISADPA